MKEKKMRYCRVVFTKKGWPPIEIDFGFFTQEQKLETVKKLRESYSDHAFTRCYSIPEPPPYGAAS